MHSEALRLYRLAREHWNAGRKDEAEAGYRQAIEADSEYGYPHYDLALLLDRKGGDSADVSDHYRRFVDLSGADPRLTSQVEWAHRRIAALDPSPASVPTVPVAVAGDEAARAATEPPPEVESCRCPNCRAALPAGSQSCSNCGQLIGGGPVVSVRTRRGLPNWAAASLGALAALVVFGVVFVALLRGGWMAWSEDAFLPAIVLSPTAVPTMPAAAVVSPTPVPPTATLAPVAATEEPPPPVVQATATQATQPTREAAATSVATAVPSAAVTQAARQTATPKPAAAAVPDELPGRLVFPVFDSERGTYDIYMSAPDGSGLRKLIEQASQPAFSADGSKLAFRRWKSDDRGVEVMDVAEGSLLRISNFLEDGLPSWSPDSETLVFFSRRESDRDVRIYQTKATGGDERELKRGAQPVHGEYPTWRSDGSIVYRATWPEIGLAVMSGDGSGERLILADGTATAPATSPDGQHVVFMSRLDGNWELYRIDTDGFGLLRLTTNSARDGLPAWSPGGGTVAFVSDRGGSWALWAMTANGRGTIKLFDLPGSPDGLVVNEPDYSSRGWLEERISWAP